MAMAEHPFLHDAVFEPDEIQMIAAALDEICREMNVPAGATIAREVVAVRVIDLAREGILDPALLKVRVLHEARAGRDIFSRGPVEPAEHVADLGQF
jgi:hypothetical protein